MAERFVYSREIFTNLNINKIKILTQIWYKMSSEVNTETVDYEAKSKTFEEENEKLKAALTEVRIEFENNSEMKLK